MRELAYDSPLYGTPAIDERLAGWADRNLRPDVDAEYRLVLANGAVDAVERLLTAHLTRGDVVAVEDPCFLSSIGTLRLNGFQTSPVPVDDDGLLPTSSTARSAAGREPSSSRRGRTIRPARASRRFAQESSAPSSISTRTSSSSRMTTSPRCLHPGITGRRRRSANRWALIRSVSKFLGPDLRLAFVAADPTTAARLESRLGSGPTWISHLLQQLTHALLTDPATAGLLDQAKRAYARRAASLADALAAHGIITNPKPDGLNVWVEFDRPVQQLVADLAESGWLVRPGDPFATENGRHRNAIRVTTATLTAFGRRRVRLRARRTAPAGSTSARPADHSDSKGTPVYTTTFIFEAKQYDDEFHRRNDTIAEQARAIPGFLGEEEWHNDATGLHAEVYYWETRAAMLN